MLLSLVEDSADPLLPGWLPMSLSTPRRHVRARAAARRPWPPSSAIIAIVVALNAGQFAASAPSWCAGGDSHNGIGIVAAIGVSQLAWALRSDLVAPWPLKWVVELALPRAAMVRLGQRLVPLPGLAQPVWFLAGAKLTAFRFVDPEQRAG